MKRGFTVLELLVASLLLSMLVTMLTMIFNQSSIAWTTGVASVSDLESVRGKLGGYHSTFDDALPGVGQTGVRDVLDTSRKIRYRTVSLFRNWNGSGQLQKNAASDKCGGRAFDEIDWSKAGDLDNYESQMQTVMQGGSKTLNPSSGGGNKGQQGLQGGGFGFVVGVRSSGPDRKMDTDDDINTFPEDVN